MATFVYLLNQPVASQDLDVSQPFLVTNNNSASGIFGLDHYAFADTTANQGLHKQVTTVSIPIISPATSPVPPTTAANPIFYGLAPTTPVGSLQWSRGPSNAVPSPLTTIQSASGAISLAPSATTDILDFTGINIAYANFYVTTASGFSLTTVYWNGSFVVQAFNPSLGGFSLTSSGNILQLINGTGAQSGIYWTLEFLRIQ